MVLNERHDYIWSNFYERPDLARVLKKDVDWNRETISDEEWLFSKILIIHLHTVRRAAKVGMFVEIKGNKSDVRDFFNCPFPKWSWRKLGRFRTKISSDLLRRRWGNNG